MQVKYAFVATTLISLQAAPSPAQTVNERSYRQYAVCTETVINGRTFSTFGEGPCPPGSRRTLPARPYDSLDPNERNMAQTQATVNALSGMQQAVLAWGQARGQRIREESARIVSTYFMDIPNSGIAPDQSKYQNLIRIFPDSGSIASANIGSPLILMQAGFYSDCYISQDGHEKKYIGWVHIIQGV
jgi:hypothetical protein